MTFSSDGGGFAFSCEDGKLSVGASTWNTRLSQLARIAGPMFVMTGMLPDPDYIGQIIGKRPRDIFIIASTKAEADARLLKSRFPEMRIALHSKNNAKLVLVAPNTVWVSSSDFGKTTQIESAMGLHSVDVYNKSYEFLFKPIWAQAVELTCPQRPPSSMPTSPVRSTTPKDWRNCYGGCGSNSNPFRRALRPTCDVCGTKQSRTYLGSQRRMRRNHD